MIVSQGGYYCGYSRKLYGARITDQRVSTETVSTLLSGIESLMLLASTKAFLNSPLDIPKVEDMVAILAGKMFSKCIALINVCVAELFYLYLLVLLS